MASILGGPRAVMFHGFSRAPRAPDPHGLFVTEDRLRSQLAGLSRAGFTFVGLDDYLAARARRGVRTKQVLVTIDDGYASVPDVAGPVMVAARVPSVCFVPAGLVGARSTWMPDTSDEAICDGDQLREAQSMGIEIGVHGMDHASLPGLSDAELVEQTSGAREVLADLVGRLPRAFAYPYGHHDKRVEAAVRRAGFEVAFAGDACGDGPFSVRRVPVRPADTTRKLALKLSPAGRRAARRWR